LPPQSFLSCRQTFSPLEAHKRRCQACLLPLFRRWIIIKSLPFFAALVFGWRFMLATHMTFIIVSTIIRAKAGGQYVAIGAPCHHQSIPERDPRRTTQRYDTKCTRCEEPWWAPKIVKRSVHALGGFRDTNNHTYYLLRALI
jgi:hypothetical protein